MVTMITQVDRLTGNYESTFIYSLNASFNGVTGDINSAQIKVFIPEYFDIFLGDVEFPVQNTFEEEVPGGRNVVFDFGTLEDLGIAVRIGFGLFFNQNAVNGQTFALNSQMYINDELQLEYTNEEIELIVNTRFEISREMVLPLLDPAPGSEIYYKVTLENFGDLGGEIENIQIISEGSDSITIDPTFEVIGSDVSPSNFKDTRYDGTIGIFNGNTVEFTLPAYRGEKYEFIYKAIINENLEIGTELVTLLDWSIDSIPETTDVNTITLNDLESSATISAYGPEYTLPNEHLAYEFNIANVGNQPLFDVTLLETLPDEIDYYRFRTGIFYISEINLPTNANYFIAYTTVLGESGEFGPFNSNVDTTVDLQFILDSGDNLATLTWQLPIFNVGVRSRIPSRIDGIVKSDIPINTTIVNDLELTYILDTGAVTIPNSKSTLVQNTCSLIPVFSQTSTNVPVKPGQSLIYTIGASCRESRLGNPIIAFLLPKELELDTEIPLTISYNDPFPNSLTPILPPAVVISDINSNGDSIIKFEFKDEFAFNFRQNSTFNITFNTKVKIGAVENLETFMILNTISSNAYIPDNEDIYKDTNNIANDPNVSDIYAKSTVRNNQILFFVSTRSNKKVKGSLDTEFVEEPLVGRSIAGGNIEYKINITNIGNAPLTKVEIVDILPHIGDTGVIETTTSRNSNYAIYTLSEVKAKITKDNEIINDTEFQIYYSNSYDPVRFGPAFDIIGTDDDWIETIPEDLVNIKSYKISTNGIELLPGETLEVDIIAVSPFGTPLNSIAWNSFAADVSYNDLSGNEAHMLAIEPEKVGVQIEPPPSDTGTIEGLIWFDTNKDGLPDIDEDGVNGVGVVLLDENGVVVNYVFTVPNFEIKNGYYSFSNIDYGNYYLRFFKEPEYVFTKKITDNPIGSKVNTKTNMTDLLVVDEINSQITINGGLIDKPQVEIETLLEINESTNKMVKDIIRNQMLLSMKTDSVICLIEDQKKNEKIAFSITTLLLLIISIITSVVFFLIL